MKKLLILAVLFPRILIAEPFFDAADQEIHEGDRILILGASGYVRVIDELKENKTLDCTEYVLIASHPWFGKWNDTIRFSENTARMGMVYRSIVTAPYIEVGENVVFFTMEEGENQLSKKEGKVTELFSGGHMMVRTSWRSSVAISYSQLIYPTVSYVPEQPSGPPYSLHAVEEMVFKKHQYHYPDYNDKIEYLKNTILTTHKAEINELFSVGRESP